jgi:hypothetical protein
VGRKGDRGPQRGQKALKETEGLRVARGLYRAKRVVQGRQRAVEGTESCRGTDGHRGDIGPLSAVQGIEGLEGRQRAIEGTKGDRGDRGL